MARKKNARSLFEVISRDAARVGKADKTGKQPLGVPGWFGRTEPTRTYAPEPQPPPAEEVAPAEAQRPVPSPPGEPIISIVGGRLRISLNQVSAAVLGLAVVLLLLGSFFLGRRTAAAPGEPTAAPPAPSKQETTERELASVPLLPPRPQTPQQPPQPPTEPGLPARRKGYVYLVIQAGISTKAQADDIESFLAERGIASSVHRSQNTRKWMVRDLRGYADSNSKQAKEYLAGVEQLGKEYFRPGRGRLYNFLGCYYLLEQ